MKRPALPLLLSAVLLAVAPSQGAQAIRSHRSASFPYNVRITPTALPSGSTSIDVGPERWSFQGFDLRGLLAEIYNVNPTRIEIPASASTAEPQRFDVTLALTGDESDATVQQILSHALQTRFHLTASIQERDVEAYVLTAPAGAGPELRAHLATPAALHAGPTSLGAHFLPAAFEDDDPQPETITIAGRLCPGISSAGITVRAASIASFAEALEKDFAQEPDSALARPIVDETGLTSAFDFQVPEYRTREELFAYLHDHLGITVTVAHRSVSILAVSTTGDTLPPLPGVDNTTT